LQDENLAQLRGILEDATQAHAAKGLVKQKIGDYYASSMEHAAVEKSGITPLEPELERIASLKSKSDIADYFGSSQFGPVGSDPLFAFRAEPDFKDSSHVIAQADQAASSLRPLRFKVLSDPVSARTLDQVSRLTIRSPREEHYPRSKACFSSSRRSASPASASNRIF